MSKIHEYNALEKLVKESMERMSVIEADPEFQREKEFENKLRALMGEYHRDLKSVIATLDPDSRRPAVFAAEKKPRKERQVIVYTNPHDNTIVESKGGNHRTLKAWNDQYGKDVVKTWAKVK